MRIPHLLRILTLFVLVVPATPARADKQKAKEHFQLGQRRYDLEKYEDAIREFEAAYVEEPSPVFLYNIAQSHRLAHHPHKAVDFYRKYLKSVPDARNRPDVEKLIATIERSEEWSRPDAPPEGGGGSQSPSENPNGGSQPSGPLVAPTPAPAATSPATVPVAAVTPPPVEEKPATKKRWPLWVGIGVGAAVVVAGAVTAGVLLGSSSEPSLGLQDAR